MSEIIHTEKIPALHEMLVGGGLPGVVYAHVSVEKVSDCYEAGFREVPYLPPYFICGVQTRLLQRGTKIDGAGYRGVSELLVDEKIREAVEDFATAPPQKSPSLPAKKVGQSAS